MSKPQLVLSLFPGADLLGLAFELEGFTVVQGPDVIFGRDIRNFHVPPGRFDGIIGKRSCLGHGGNSGDGLAYRLAAQGLPADWLKDAPFTAGAKSRLVGNGVPLPMGRAVARAVRRALGMEAVA